MIKAKKEVIKKCHKCNIIRSNDKKDKFCYVCGFELDREVKNTCPACKHKYHPVDDFCPRCGLCLNK